MQKATVLQPLPRPKRDREEVKKWQKHRVAWLSRIRPNGLFHPLFDHIPGVYFFAKDHNGHLMMASEGLRRRYSMEDETEILGMTDFDLNPDRMARSYVRDDQEILAGRASMVERFELWWDSQGMPDWFLVTKLPIHDIRGRVVGVMGLLRRPDANEERLPVIQAVSKAVAIMRQKYASPLTMVQVASECGQSLRNLQRRFKAGFGISPQEFLLKTRVLAAMRLLRESDLAVAQVARSCGFVDASSLAAHFRKRTGTSPLAYRRRE